MAAPPNDIATPIIAETEPCSRDGNQSLMICAVLGTSPAWASPKASRLSSRGKNEKTKDVQTVIADHNTLNNGSALRVPIRRPTAPPGI